MRIRSAEARAPSSPAGAGPERRRPLAAPERSSRDHPPFPLLPAALAMLAALLGVGCMGKVVPQSAQAGTTVAIPLQGMRAVAPVGFGGTEVEDPQRGELVYLLDAPSGPVELTTRGSTAVGPHAGSATARFNTRLYQVVSLVDIPRDAPVGTHSVDVVWRHPDPATGDVLETPVDYEGELTVLPPSLEISGSSGVETITGEPTPFERWACGLSGGCDWDEIVPSKLQSVVPDPSLRLQLDTTVWAAELEVSYPAGVIDVLDVYETPFLNLNRRATTWLDDDGAGALTLSAAATRSGFDSLSVAFGLDDPAASILDPADVSVSVVRAWDRDGNEIAAAASVGGVF